MKKGFTIIEMVIVLICVSLMTILVGFNIKNVQETKRAEIFVQEALLLRQAFVSYYETKGGFVSASGALSDASFDVYRPYWYPFLPQNSKVEEGAYWYGEIDGDEPRFSHLTLKSQKTGECIPLSNRTLNIIKEKGKWAYQCAGYGGNYSVYFWHVVEELIPPAVYEPNPSRL